MGRLMRSPDCVKHGVQVLNLAAEVMQDALHVSIDQDALEGLKTKLSYPGNRRPWPTQGDVVLSSDLTLSRADSIFYEMMAGAVNYCYWFARCNIRPGGASSTTMYNLLTQAWRDAWCPGCSTDTQYELVVEAFAASLCANRFPLASQRVDHLYELANSPARIEFIECVMRFGDTTVNEALAALVRGFAGFASDPFLKRAQLVMIMLHRRYSYFPDIDTVTIPADYQVPRALRHEGVLVYRSELLDRIIREEIIHSGTAAEAEIRAATIIACDALRSEHTTIVDVDNYLWQAGRAVDKTVPFHLTVTTDY